MLEEWRSLHRQALRKISPHWLLAVEVNSCIKLEMLKGSPAWEQCPCPAWQQAPGEGPLFLTGFCWGSSQEWFGMGVWVPCSPGGAQDPVALLFCLAPSQWWITDRAPLSPSRLCWETLWCWLDVSGLAGEQMSLAWVSELCFSILLHCVWALDCSNPSLALHPLNPLNWKQR